MKAISTSLKTFLQTSQSALMCDLYTLTLGNGAQLFYTDCPINVVMNGHTYVAVTSDGVAAFSRGPVKLGLGLKVNSTQVFIKYDANTRILGATPGSFANNGGFDMCRIQVDKFITDDFANTSRGVVNVFTGVVTDVEVGDTNVTLNVSDDLVFLNGQFPRNFFLPACNHSLFDAGCGLLKSTYAVNSSVSSAGDNTHINASGLTQAAGYFALGWLQMTSGVANGLVRIVKTYSTGYIELLYPFSQIPQVGDTFTIYPGCDKLQNTCSTKFNNLVHFRGFPDVPTPEQIEMGGNTSSPSDSGQGTGVGSVRRGVGGQRGKFFQE